MTSRASAAQEPLSVNQNAGDHRTAHQAVTVIGGHYLEPEEAAIEVIEASGNPHRLTDRKSHEVFEFNASADRGARRRQPCITQSRDAGSLRKR